VVTHSATSIINHFLSIIYALEKVNKYEKCNQDD